MSNLIKNALAALDKKRERILGWEDAVEVVELCAKAFPDLLPAVSLGYTAMSIQGVLLHVYVKDMEKNIAPVLRFLGRAGYPKKGKPEDYAEFKRRTWTCDGDVKVLAFLRGEDDDVCEYVQIGVTEEPVYELQCTKKVAV